MKKEELSARRVLCFAHSEGKTKEKLTFDGFISIHDEIRSEVFSAVKKCFSAGIDIKILTGDNRETAFAVAKELGVVKGEQEIINANEIENLDDEKLKKLLKKVKVIARSTPIIKLRVVKALKESGEVVAVTGDGINDAPAIKQADVGFSMGKTGSDITKESADIVLLDDSFSTIVSAISFGRNVYRNLQRFIYFQLSVNLSALLVVSVCALFGVKSPFNTFQLLWINVIMDGPPALTLGLEKEGNNLMNYRPVKRDKSIISVNLLLKIIFTGVFIALITCLQYFCNILRVKESEKYSATFSLFVLFQLFNAFNCRELGAESILKNIGKNKIMILTFLGVFIVQVFITEVCGKLFSLCGLEFLTYVKIVLLSLSIIVMSEIIKIFIRLIKKNNIEKKLI